MDFKKYYQENKKEIDEIENQKLLEEIDENKNKDIVITTALKSMEIELKPPVKMDTRKDFMEDKESGTKSRVIFYDMFHKESNK